MFRKTSLLCGIKPLDKANLKQWRIQGRRGHKPPYLSSQVLENTREDPRGKFRDALLGLRLGGDGERGRKLQIDNLKDLTREELDRMLYGTSNITNLRRYNLASHPYLNSVISTPEVAVNFVFLLDGEADRKNALKGFTTQPPIDASPVDVVVNEEVTNDGKRRDTSTNPTDGRILKMRSMIRKAAGILENQVKAIQAQKATDTPFADRSDEEKLSQLKEQLNHSRAVKHIQFCTRSHTLDIRLRRSSDDAHSDGLPLVEPSCDFEKSVEDACRLLLNAGDILVPDEGGNNIGNHHGDSGVAERRRIPLVCNEKAFSSKLENPDDADADAGFERYEATIGGCIDVCLWRGRSLVKNLQFLRDKHPFALKLHQQTELEVAGSVDDGEEGPRVKTEESSKRSFERRFSARNYQPKRNKWKDEASTADDLFRWHFSVNDPRSHFSDQLGHNRTMSVIALVTQPFDGFSNMMHPFLRDRVKKFGFNPVKESDPLEIAKKVTIGQRNIGRERSSNVDAEYSANTK